MTYHLYWEAHSPGHFPLLFGHLRSRHPPTCHIRSPPAGTSAVSCRRVPLLLSNTSNIVCLLLNNSFLLLSFTSATHGGTRPLQDLSSSTLRLRLGPSRNSLLQRPFHSTLCHLSSFLSSGIRSCTVTLLGSSINTWKKSLYGTFSQGVIMVVLYCDI